MDTIKKGGDSVSYQVAYHFKIIPVREILTSLQRKGNPVIKYIHLMNSLTNVLRKKKRTVKEFILDKNPELIKENARV